MDWASPNFAEKLQALMDELEGHMFKEEMRRFPMMAQGGNALMQLLVDDMLQEHARHGVDTAAMTARLNALVVPQAQQATLAQVKVGWQAFLAELAKHVAAEDDALFLMFQPASPA
ncbi:hemerythrin domain-containing protein [Rhodoferax antarcticus]|uniref:hemerythrin domain-containing protein n=1 Tax=Rhodoferax antarcticus TaxID=81479 RepID=UPI002224B9CE|nr:hemerythrin domain-containing protein [Rhodoferax antarcticus]MCW2313764.1 iron-sulfur cluster repair protein YtfE (RIC family) [Rhodoferax antarcticus]